MPKKGEGVDAKSVYTLTMMSLDKFAEYFKAHNHFDRASGFVPTIKGPGVVEYRFQVQEQHLSSPGVAHGGAIAGFMDCVLGLTALSLALTDNHLVSTVEFKLNFIRPARLGETIIGTGKIDYKGKSLIIASGDIRTEAGDLVAKGLGTFNTYPLEKKGDLFSKLQEA